MTQTVPLGRNSTHGHSCLHFISVRNCAAFLGCGVALAFGCFASLVSSFLVVVASGCGADPHFVILLSLLCPGVLAASSGPSLLRRWASTCGSIISICPRSSLNSGSLQSHKCWGPWANPVSLVDRIHDRITSCRVINIIWVLINFKLWKEVFMSSERYCLQKELSRGICNLFGRGDTSVAWQENFSPVSGKGGGCH